MIAGCAVTGEAAGTAAAMAAERNDGRVRELDIPALQGRLKEQGVRLEGADGHIPRRILEVDCAEGRSQWEVCTI
jgi:hypothetical protein